MDILTVNVGQGSLAVVRHNAEALIVDARMPPANDDTVAYVKGILAAYLKGFYVKGLILTGYDQDHCDAACMGLVLRKYRPDWVMYPKYYKDSEEATSVFRLIAQQVGERAGSSKPLKRYSVCVDDAASHNLYGMTANFTFELFSPHTADMDCSNNSSIVLRVTGVGAGGFSYLVTGDTETARWDSINKYFGNALRSDVMAAPHHGSRNGVNAKTLLLIDPNTVLISAGVDNQYGHPDSQAVTAYGKVAKHVHSTSVGVSLLTSQTQTDFQTVSIT